MNVIIYHNILIGSIWPTALISDNEDIWAATHYTYYLCSNGKYGHCLVMRKTLGQRQIHWCKSYCSFLIVEFPLVLNVCASYAYLLRQGL